MNNKIIINPGKDGMYRSTSRIRLRSDCSDEISDQNDRSSIRNAAGRKMSENKSDEDDSASETSGIFGLYWIRTKKV